MKNGRVRKFASANLHGQKTFDPTKGLMYKKLLTALKSALAEEMKIDNCIEKKYQSTKGNSKKINLG